MLRGKIRVRLPGSYDMRNAIALNAFKLCKSRTTAALGIQTTPDHLSHGHLSLLNRQLLCSFSSSRKTQPDQRSKLRDTKNQASKHASQQKGRMSSVIVAKQKQHFNHLMTQLWKSFKAPGQWLFKGALSYILAKWTTIMGLLTIVWYFFNHNKRQRERLMHNSTLHRLNTENKGLPARFEALMKNPEWNLEDAFDFLENQDAILYFHGDQGIGKSSFMAALVCHLNDKEMKPLLLQKFAALADFNGFIYLDGTWFQHCTTGYLSYRPIFVGVVTFLKYFNFLIFLDDAHKVIKPTNKTILQDWLVGYKKLVCISSQPYFYDDRDYLKDRLKMIQTLTELPKENVINQFKEAISNHLVGQALDPCQREYLAHRLWFYCGERASEMVKSETVKGQGAEGEQTERAKSEYFTDTVNYLREVWKVQPEEMVDLEFGSCDKTKIKGLVGSKYENLFKMKILVALKSSTLKDESKTVICFHSRRSQYGVSRYYLENDLFWINQPIQARVLFQQLLERIEYRHILSFEMQLYKQLKGLREKQNDIDNLKVTLQKSSGLKQKQMIQTKINELKSKIEDDAKVNDLFEKEIDLLMALYEAYQSSPQYVVKFEEIFWAGEILDSLKLGPEIFKDQYKYEIEAGLKKRAELRDKIKNTENKLREAYLETRILRKRADFMKMLTIKWFKELRDIVNPDKQQGNQEDILNEFNPECEEVSEKLFQIQKELLFKGGKNKASDQLRYYSIDVAKELAVIGKKKWDRYEKDAKKPPLT